MNTSRLTSLVLALGVIAASLVAMTRPATASDPTAAPTRVMVVGDSVTRGRDEDYTWRYFLHKGLVQTGADVDLVGPNGVAPHAAMDFDQDNASWWGFTVWQMADHGWWPDAPRIDNLVTFHQPDVIVEQLGINDLVWVNVSPQGLINQLQTVIAEARSAKPDVDFVLGSLPQTWIKNVVSYNALLVDLAPALSTPESRVVVTPVAEWTEGVETYDRVHPSALGEIALAEAVSFALEELGVGTAVRMSLPTVTPPLTPPIVLEPTPVVPAPEPEEPVGVVPPVTPPVTPVEPVTAPVSLEPPAAAPDAPLLRAKVLANGKIKVSWSAQAASVRVWVRDVTSRQRWTALGGSVAPTASRVVRAADGHRLKFRATATGTGGVSPLSAVVTVRAGR